MDGHAGGDVAWGFDDGHAAGLADEGARHLSREHVSDAVET
ncbi:hypothetical protein AB0M92_29620 [Streptomyces sp. NPDC051582]